MAAGQLAYKLCDREFDCDHCPLDAALQGRGTSLRPNDHTPEPTRWEFPDDRVYAPSHAWVQSLHGRFVRYGLDVLAARLLNRTTALVPPPVASRVTVGEPVCWLLDDSRFIPLRSPVTGSVARVNDRVTREPGLLSDSPYHDGWLLEIACDESLEQQNDLFNAAQQRDRVACDLKAIQALAHRTDGDYVLGPTLEDGGEPTLPARQKIGAEGYHRLLRDLLS